ncbi:synaptogenesis protein syg-2-like [Dreissena polymorpha]|nr:synaptogenesis protein syg-2-like [Dreissena polymorpha]
MVCATDGDPTPSVRIINATRSSKMMLSETTTFKAHAYIHRARCEYDSGVYKCVANNTHNQEEREHTCVVNIQCSPRASPFSPSTHNVYRALNDAAVFIFTLIAYPEPDRSNFSWYRRIYNNWVALQNSTNYSFYVAENRMKTQLMISRVHVDDFTDYMVSVSNTLGSTTETFTLHAQSIPNVPKDVRIDRVGITNIGISWLPEFNGGEDQNFTIRYKEVQAGNWIYIFIASSIVHYKWTIEGLKQDTEYAIEILAENKIGKSNWTLTITTRTIFNEVENGPTSISIGGAVGGSTVGIGMVVAVIVFIWKYRNRGQNTNKTNHETSLKSGQYEYFVRERSCEETLSTDGTYAICRYDYRPADNKYETLAEQLEFRDYSSLSSKPSPLVENATDCHSSLNGVFNDDCEYVNMKLSIF